MSKPECNIPFWNTSFQDTEVEEVIRAIQDRKISQGKITEEVEETIKDRLEGPEVIMVTSGSMALVIALMSIGLKPGDEVIIPNRTWIATAHAVLMLGGIVKLVDCKPGTQIIDDKKIEEKITSKTRVIIPVHINGKACDMENIKTIASRHNLTVVEDAAQAFMCKYKDKYVGTIGEIGCFSLSVPKIISTGQGGFCVTKNRELAERIRKIRTHGVENVLKVDKWIIQGGNFRYTDIQAAICKAQLKKLDKNIENVKKLNDIYRRELTNKDFLSLTRGHNNDEIPIYNDYIVKNIDKWLEFFKAKNIEVRRFYPSMDKMRYIEENKRENEIMTYSVDFDERGLYLPSGPNADITRITQLIKDINSADKN